MAPGSRIQIAIWNRICTGPATVSNDQRKIIDIEVTAVSSVMVKVCVLPTSTRDSGEEMEAPT